MALGWAPDRDRAARFRGRDRHVGLDEALVRAGHDVPALDQHLGRGEAGRDVAPVLAGDGADVVGPCLRLGLGVAAAMDGHVVEALGAFLEDLRRLLLHRLEGIGDRRQLVVIDRHQGGPVGGRGFGLADHRGDRLSDVVDLALGQGLVGAGDVDLLQVGVGQHRDDAGDRQGGLLVNACDAGARIGAQHQLGVQQPEGLEVLRVAGFPPQLLRSLEAAGAAGRHCHRPRIIAVRAAGTSGTSR